MATAQIKITFRQIIDHWVKPGFEKRIFDASYREFLVKSSVYNPNEKYAAFSEIRRHDDRAETLHYKLGFAVMHLFEELNGNIPDLADTLGQPVKFHVPELQLLESNIHNKSAHKLAVNYSSGALILHQLIGDLMLLSVPASEQDSRKEEASTFMLQLRPMLAITAYQEYQNRVASDFTGFAAN